MKPGAACLVVALLAGCGRTAPPPEGGADNGLAAFRIESGLWEVRSVVVAARARNLPIQVRDRLVGARPTVRACLGSARAERPLADLLAGRRGCAYRDLRLDGEHLTGMMACPEPGAAGPTMARLDGRYGRGGYDLSIEMISPMPDGTPMVLQIRTAGRRIADCEAQHR